MTSNMSLNTKMNALQVDASYMQHGVWTDKIKDELSKNRKIDHIDLTNAPIDESRLFALLKKLDFEPNAYLDQNHVQMHLDLTAWFKVKSPQEIQAITESFTKTLQVAPNIVTPPGSDHIYLVCTCRREQELENQSDDSWVLVPEMQGLSLAPKPQNSKPESAANGQTPQVSSPGQAQATVVAKPAAKPKAPGLDSFLDSLQRDSEEREWILKNPQKIK